MSSENPQPKQLYRSVKNRLIAGVAGGLGEYLTIDPTVIRILFIFLAFTGAGFVAYLVLWFIVPQEGVSPEKPLEERMRDNAHTVAEEMRQTFSGERSDKAAGIWLLAIGLIFLLINFGLFSWNIFGKVWPIILIFIGWRILQNPRK